MARFPAEIPNIQAFYNLDIEQIYALIQKYVKPRSREEFIQELPKSIVFPSTSVETYGVTQENYVSLHAALLAYNLSFSRALSFLAYDNRACLPYIDNKPGGIIFL